MERRSAIVLDVRTADEFNAGHLENALNLDVQKDDFAQQLSNFDKNKTYLVHCKSGRRSEKALNILAQLGFTKAYHLKGGYGDWNKKRELSNPISNNVA